LVFSVKPPSDVDAAEIIFRSAFHEKVEGVAVKWGLVTFESHKLTDEIPEFLLALKLSENLTSILVLSFYPGSRLRAILIFEPAIRIDKLYAVDDLPDFMAGCWRWTESKHIGGEKGCSNKDAGKDA